MQIRRGRFTHAYGNNRQVKYWPDEIKQAQLIAKRWEIDAWARDRSIAPDVVHEVASAALRLGRIPDLGGLGLSYDDSEALGHFITDAFLNMEDEGCDNLDEARRMTTKQAIAELKRTRKLNTAMLKPLNISMDSFLAYAQRRMSKAENDKFIDKTIDYLEKKHGKVSEDLDEGYRPRPHSKVRDHRWPGRKDLKNTNLKAVLLKARANAERVAMTQKRGDTPAWKTTIDVLNYIDNALKLLKEGIEVDVDEALGVCDLAGKLDGLDLYEDTRRGSYTSATTKKSYPFRDKERQYRNYKDDQLHFARQDAYKAEKAAASMGDEIAAGWYSDDVHTINKEMRRRGLKPKRLRESAFKPSFELTLSEFKPLDIGDEYADQFTRLVNGANRPSHILDKSALADEGQPKLNIKSPVGTRLTIEMERLHGDPIQYREPGSVRLAEDEDLAEARGKKLKKKLKLKSGVSFGKGTAVDRVEFFQVGYRWGVTLYIGGQTVKLAASRLGTYVSGYGKAPSMSTMNKWMDQGIAKTVTGKRVEPDGTGPDGSPSWLLVLGMI